MIKAWKHYWRRSAFLRRGVLERGGEEVWNVGGWATAVDGIGPDSHVLSFGVGDNVVWDLALIERFGCTVHAFDPTPGSIDWVRGQSLPREFVFHEFGLADFNGELTFYPPKKQGNTHFSQDRRRHNRDDSGAVRGSVRRLDAIAEELGRKVDILKMDVEGSEFDAIPDVLASDVRVRQLLVEIHYHHPERSFAEGWALVEMLQAAGYRCFAVSRRGLEFSFLRDDVAASRRAA